MVLIMVALRRGGFPKGLPGSAIHLLARLSSPDSRREPRRFRQGVGQSWIQQGAIHRSTVTSALALTIVPMNLENQTALITGSSGGIGEDFAVAFAKRKVNLVLVARREDKLAALRTRLLEQHPGLTIDIITADLSVPGSAARSTFSSTMPASACTATSSPKASRRTPHRSS